MLKIKHFIQQSWLLIVASFFFGLLIAVTSASWQDEIIRNEQEKLNRLMKELISDANSFEVVMQKAEIPGDKKILKSDIYKALDVNGSIVGFAFNAEGSGFADKIELVVAVDKDFEKLAGFDVLSSNETPGFGDQIKYDYYRDQFAGAPAEELKLVTSGKPKNIDAEIVAISGATVSSEAVVEIINNFLTQIKKQMQQ